MKLYHGSNVTVKNPKIIESDRALDFGTGFYLTTDFEQAKKWAIITTERRKKGKSLISVFEILEEELTPIRERRKKYEENIDEVYRILEEGTKCARKYAMETLSEVKRAMKLNYFE